MLLIFFHVFLKDVQVGYEYRSRYMPISKAMKWNMIKLGPFFHKIKTSPDTETTLQSPAFGQTKNLINWTVTHVQSIQLEHSFIFCEHGALGAQILRFYINSFC